MVHRRLDVALGAEVLRAVVIEIIVRRREVSVERVEVAGLLDAIPNACELCAQQAPRKLGGTVAKFDA